MSLFEQLDAACRSEHQSIAEKWFSGCVQKHVTVTDPNFAGRVEHALEENAPYAELPTGAVLPRVKFFSADVTIAEGAYGEGCFALSDGIAAKTLILREHGLVVKKKNKEAMVCYILLSPADAPLAKLCSGDDRPDEGDSWCPFVNWDIASWRMAHRMVALNSFKDKDNYYLFGTASKFNHSCKPNAKWQIVNGCMRVYTLRSISPDEEVTIRYSRKAGRDGDVFACKCEVCCTR